MGMSVLELLSNPESSEEINKKMHGEYKEDKKLVIEAIEERALIISEQGLQDEIRKSQERKVDRSAAATVDEANRRIDETIKKQGTAEPQKQAQGSNTQQDAGSKSQQSPGYQYNGAASGNKYGYTTTKSDEEKMDKMLKHVFTAGEYIFGNEDKNEHFYRKKKKKGWTPMDFILPTKSKRKAFVLNTAAGIIHFGVIPAAIYLMLKKEE